MLNGKTVIVLGAGSSKSFDLPVGAELIDQIHNISKVDFSRFADRNNSTDRKFTGLLEEIHRKQQVDLATDTPYRRVVQACLSAKSIDDFIDFEENESISTYAKIAISYCILKSEHKSHLRNLFNQNQVNHFDARFRGSWLEKLFTLTIKGTKKNLYKNSFSDISIINFNYDRCIECYLYNAIKIVFQLNSADAWNVVSNIKVVRPYGSIGNIKGDGAVPFGGSYEGPTSGDLVSSYKTIKTYTESIESDTMEKINKYCDGAKNLIFLGFGFHPQNMKILKESKITIQENIFSTIYKQSNYTSDMIKAELKALSENSTPNIHLHNGDCESFFNTYEMGLTGY